MYIYVYIYIYYKLTYLWSYVPETRESPKREMFGLWMSLPSISLLSHDRHRRCEQRTLWWVVLTDDLRRIL